MKKMRIYLITIVLIVISSCSGQTSADRTEKHNKESIKTDSSVQDSLAVFFIYGELAPDGYLDDENSITESYGFKLKRIAGCEVDETIVNEAHVLNKKTLIEMNKKYGNDWMDSFEKKTKYKLVIPFN